MTCKQLIAFLCLQLLYFSTSSQPIIRKDDMSLHPFYVGVMGGYGSTTWNGLVPAREKQNVAMNTSTPIKVREGGGMLGLLIGYELIPYFALEVNYMHFQDAKILFDSSSLFSFLHDGLTEFRSQTKTINVQGKFMVFVPNTKLRAYSSAGVAQLHRIDILSNHWHVEPTFGVGLNYHITPHIMAELAGNYTAGYGESQLNPTDSYFPFLYSASFRLAYCF